MCVRVRCGRLRREGRKQSNKKERTKQETEERDKYTNDNVHSWAAGYTWVSWVADTIVLVVAPVRQAIVAIIIEWHKRYSPSFHALSTQTPFTSFSSVNLFSASHVCIVMNLEGRCLDPTLTVLFNIQVACGKLHTAIVTDTGTVFTWGDSRENQLGYPPKGCSFPLTLVSPTRVLFSLYPVVIAPLFLLAHVVGLVCLRVSHCRLYLQRNPFARSTAGWTIRCHGGLWQGPYSRSLLLTLYLSFSLSSVYIFTNFYLSISETFLLFSRVILQLWRTWVHSGHGGPLNTINAAQASAPPRLRSKNLCRCVLDPLTPLTPHCAFFATLCIHSLDTVPNNANHPNHPHLPNNPKNP